MIDRENWQRVSGLLDEALALGPGERLAWLTALAQREPVLAARVASMLEPLDGGDDPTRPGGGVVGEFERLLGPALADAPRPVAPDLANTMLGPWQLVEKIGEGGMGQVWRARRADGLYEAQAAIKLLRGDLPAASLAGRFARERAVLARLNHPAIARLLDAGVAGDQAYLVLELVEGQSLADYVRGHCLTVAERVRLMVQIAEAVDFAHAQLVVHRDLKPSNVLVTHDGQPKLLDFGIAGLLDDDGQAVLTNDLTRMTSRMLTLGYASPEQISGQPIGVAADVFSLGVMLYETITGGLPFGKPGGSRAQQEFSVMHDEPRRFEDVPESAQGPGRPTDMNQARGDLEAVVATALRKNPAQRYGSVRMLMQDLGHWLAHRPVTVRRENRWHNTRLWLRRHSLLALSVLLVTASLAAGLGLSLWQWQRAQAAARTSDQVTSYLSELLGSASPDAHGGKVPTVLQLLERSRKDIAERFADSPDTRLRLLSVVTQTYRQFNRHDLAMPLGQALVDQSLERYGPDDIRSLRARIEQAANLQLLNQCDKVLASLEPAMPLMRKVLVGHDDDLFNALLQLGTCYSHLGRFDQAERTMAEVEPVLARMPASDMRRGTYLNILHVMQVDRGRLQDGLAALEQTRPLWTHTEPQYQRELLVWQRNMVALKIRMGRYDGVETQVADLLGRIDLLLKPGSGLAMSLRDELVRYQLWSGQWVKAREQRADNLAYAHASGPRQVPVELTMQSQLLAAQALTHSITPDALRNRVQLLLDQTRANLDQLGQRRADIWASLARAALAYDQGDLAAAALEALAHDPGLEQSNDLFFQARKNQLQGQLARLRGDLAASSQLLGQRLKFNDRLADRRVVASWQAALDHAWTLVLQADAGAPAALADAAARRPETLPPDHPLDAATHYLQERLRVGRDDAPSLVPLRQALAKAMQGTTEPAFSGPGRASLYGAFY
jgi:serine/threonine-protein kinase